MAACVTVTVAGVCAQQVGQARTVRQHALKVFMVRAVRSDAGVIITPHATTSLAPACVPLAGEGLTAKRFVYLVLMGSVVLIDASVLMEPPVTM